MYIQVTDVCFSHQAHHLRGSKWSSMIWKEQMNIFWGEATKNIVRKRKIGWCFNFFWYIIILLCIRMSKLSIGHKILEINRIQKPANLPAKGFFPSSLHCNKSYYTRNINMNNRHGMKNVWTEFLNECWSPILFC